MGRIQAQGVRGSSPIMLESGANKEPAGMANAGQASTQPQQPVQRVMVVDDNRHNENGDCTDAGGCCRSQSSRYPPSWERFFCNDGTKTQPSVATQGHLAFVFFATIFALILGNYAADGLGELPAFDDCNGVDSCIKNFIVYRISFAFFIFFLTLTLVTADLCGCQWEQAMASCHYGWWYMKISYALLLFVIVFFLPHGLFEAYEHFSRIAGGFFILMQVVLLIDFAYVWNETWAFEPEGSEVGDDELSNWRIALLVISVLFFGSSWTISVLMYSWFNETGSCGLPISMVTITLVGCLVLTCLSFYPGVVSGSLITSAVVTFTVTFMTFDALFNHSSTCNSLLGEDSADSWRTFVGLILSAVAVTRMGYNVIANDAFNNAAPKDTRSVRDADGREGPAAQVRETNFFYFHLVLALSMSYMAMLLTDWGAGSSGSNTSMWVKITTSWITMLLYGWSLVAPLVFPDRDFGQHQPGSAASAV